MILHIKIIVISLTSVLNNVFTFQIKDKKVKAEGAVAAQLPVAYFKNWLQ